MNKSNNGLKQLGACLAILTSLTATSADAMTSQIENLALEYRLNEYRACATRYYLRVTANVATVNGNYLWTSARFIEDCRKITAPVNSWRRMWQRDLNYFDQQAAFLLFRLQAVDPQHPIVAQLQQPVVIQPQPVVAQAQQQNAQMQEDVPNQAEVTEVGVFRRIGNFFSNVFSSAVDWVRGLFRRRDPAEDALNASLLGNV